MFLRRDQLKMICRDMKSKLAASNLSKSTFSQIEDVAYITSLTTGSRIILFNFTQHSRAQQLVVTTPISTQRANIWRHVNGIWSSRVEACAQSIPESSKDVFMVEGAFPYGSDQVVYAFTTVKVDPEHPAEDLERYSIINNVFRLGCVFDFTTVEVQRSFRLFIAKRPPCRQLGLAWVLGIPPKAVPGSDGQSINLYDIGVTFSA